MIHFSTHHAGTHRFVLYLRLRRSEALDLVHSYIHIQSSQMNKGVSSSGRLFSSNKREPGADASHFRLSTSAVPHRARATNSGNNKRSSRRTAKCAGSTLMNASLSDFADEDLLYYSLLVEIKLSPTMLVVNSERISAKYIGELVRQNIICYLRSNFFFLLRNIFPSRETRRKSRQEDEEKKELFHENS